MAKSRLGCLTLEAPASLVAREAFSVGKETRQAFQVGVRRLDAGKALCKPCQVYHQSH